MKLLFIFIIALVAGSAGIAAEGEQPQSVITAGAHAGKVVEYLYKSTPTTALKAFVHFPEDWASGGKRPGIVFFFGGGWQAGSPTQFDFQAKYFATRGMVAVRADYRIASRDRVTPEICVEDAKSAMRWVRSHASELGIDPNRIVAAGGSAGGHLAACTALIDGFDAVGDDRHVSSVPNAMVLFNPVVDLKRIPPGHITSEEIAQQISPTNFVRKGTPPAILFFGTADQFLNQGRDFVSKSKSAGNRAELYTAAGQPHAFFNRSPWLEMTTRQADEFLCSL